MAEILHQLIGSLSHYLQGVIYTRPFGTLGYPIMTHPRMEGPNPSCVIIRTGARMPMYGKTSMKGHEGIACLAPIPSK